MTTPPDEFEQPGAGGDKFDPHEFMGELLIFVPQSFMADMPTRFGVSDAATTDIIIVTGPQAGTVLKDAMLFGNLSRSVKQAIGGGKVLGRIGQGPATGNKNPPWLIIGHTDADVALARPALAAYAAGQFNQPGGATPPPSAAPAPGWNLPPQPAGWGSPPPTTPVAAPPTPAPAATPAVEAPAPGTNPLWDFLVSKGVNPAGLASREAAHMIAQSYGWTG